jgi:hypothetical protein
MFSCCCKRNKQHINRNNDTILRTLLDQLVELNIKYNTEFNNITNELNKIKLILENNVIYELDFVRKNTPESIYIPPKHINISSQESIRTNSIDDEIVLEDTSQTSIIFYV